MDSDMGSDMGCDMGSDMGSDMASDSGIYFLQFTDFSFVGKKPFLFFCYEVSLRIRVLWCVDIRNIFCSLFVKFKFVSPVIFFFQNKSNR